MPSNILDLDSLALTTAVPLTRHPAAVYLSMLGKGSRSTMRQSLNAIAAMLTNGKCDHLALNWAALRYEHTAAVQGILLEKYEPTTVKKMMCALRRVLKEAYRLRLIDFESYDAAVDLPSVKLTKRLRGRALSQDEIAALIDVCQCDRTPKGIRDSALLGILRGAGLRRAEVVKLNLEDFNPEVGSLEIRSGKGGKDRTVYLPQEVIPLVLDWLKIRGNEPGLLLCPILKNGRLALREMTPQAVLLIVQRRGKQAEVESFTPPMISGVHFALICWTLVWISLPCRN